MKKDKTLQYFTEEYLQECKKLTPEQILAFLEDFQSMYAENNNKVKSKLISMKVPEDLLEGFKIKASLERTPYQTMIKILMKDWLKN